MNLKNLLSDKNALRLVHILSENGFQAFYVGGCVRDALIGQQPHDIDICTDALPEQVLSMLHENKIYSLEVGVRFGTVIAVLDNEQYEITTFRCDGVYTDSRRPDEVQFVQSLQEDVSRRDFTINAMAFDPLECELIDFYNGYEDLKSGLIRCVGNANERFNEDALRMLRALRFAIRYGFHIEEETALAIHENRFLLQNISKERITSEFEKIFSYNRPIHNIFLEFSDVVATIIPEIDSCIGFDQNNKYHCHDVYEHMLNVCDMCDTTDFNVKLAALLHDIGKPECYTEDEEGYGHFYGHPEVCAQIVEKVLKNNFRVSNADYGEIVTLVKFHDIRPSNTDRSARKLIINIGKDRVDKWVILKNADIADHNGVAEYYVDLPLVIERAHKLIEEQDCFKITDLEVSGKDVMSILNIKTGKKVGLVLKDLFDRVVDGEVENDREQLIKLVERYR